MRNVFITTLGVCLATPAVADLERTIPAETVQHITVAVGSADITVTGWKEKKVRIDADTDPGVTVDGKNLVIGSFDVENLAEISEAVAQGHGEASEITVRMPATAALTVRTLAGDVTVKAVSGRVHIAVISGDVRVDACSGPVEIEAVSGDIDIRDLSADLSAQSVSGEVSVKGFKGLMLEAKSVSGSVTVRGAQTRSVRITSHSGDLTYAGSTAEDGSVELTTFSGHAVVEVPKGTGFEVDATTFSGSVSLGPKAEISHRSEHRLRARTTEPGPRLRLKSHSGDVGVR